MAWCSLKGALQRIGKSVVGLVERQSTIMRRRRFRVPLSAPTQPFGPNFGLTIFPNFAPSTEVYRIRDAMWKAYFKDVERVRAVDGRTEVSSVAPDVFENVVDRLVDSHFAPSPDYFNHQSVYHYSRGDCCAPRVDNIIMFDDIVATFTTGCPALLKFVGIQNGECLETILPEDCVYVIEGAARYAFFHMIMPVQDKRLDVVLKRSIARMEGTFGTSVAPEFANVSRLRGDGIRKLLEKNKIGVPRFALDESWRTYEYGKGNKGFNRVEALHAPRDWSLQKQLEEDFIRYEDLRRSGQLDADLSRRFSTLRETFRIIEEDISIKPREHPPT